MTVKGPGKGPLLKRLLQPEVSVTRSTSAGNGVSGTRIFRALHVPFSGHGRATGTDLGVKVNLSKWANLQIPSTSTGRCCRVAGGVVSALALACVSGTDPPPGVYLGGWQIPGSLGPQLCCLCCVGTVSLRSPIPAASVCAPTCALTDR